MSLPFDPNIDSALMEPPRSSRKAVKVPDKITLRELMGIEERNRGHRDFLAFVPRSVDERMPVSQRQGTVKRHTIADGTTTGHSLPEPSMTWNSPERNKRKRATPHHSTQPITTNMYLHQKSVSDQGNGSLGSAYSWNDSPTTSAHQTAIQHAALHSQDADDVFDEFFRNSSQPGQPANTIASGAFQGNDSLQDRHMLQRRQNKKRRLMDRMEQQSILLPVLQNPVPPPTARSKIQPVARMLPSSRHHFNPKSSANTKPVAPTTPHSKQSFTPRHGLPLALIEPYAPIEPYGHRQSEGQQSMAPPFSNALDGVEPGFDLGNLGFDDEAAPENFDFDSFLPDPNDLNFGTSAVVGSSHNSQIATPGLLSPSDVRAFPTTPLSYDSSSPQLPAVAAVRSGEVLSGTLKYTISTDDTVSYTSRRRALLMALFDKDL